MEQNTEIRKVVREILNESSEITMSEGIFSCAIEDLYTAIKNYVDTSFRHVGHSTNLKVHDNYVSVNIAMTPDRRMYSLDNESIINELKKTANIHERLFVDKFYDFCGKGFKGMKGLFGGDTNKNDISALATLKKVTRVPEGEDRVLKFESSSEKPRDLGTEKEYKSKFGNAHLDKIYIQIGVFPKTV